MSAEDNIGQNNADDPYATRRLRVAPTAEPARGRVGAPTSSGVRARRGLPPLGRWLLNLLVIAIVLLLVGIPAGLYYLDRQYEGKIYPNVTIGGVGVGELTPEEAEAALRERQAAFLTQPVTLSFRNQSWQPTAGELGLQFDFRTAIETAYNSGRGRGLIDDLTAINAIWQNGLAIPLHASADARAVQQVVRQISAELEQPPIDATIALEQTLITTTPMQIGRQVEIDNTVREVSDALLTLTPQNIVVRTRELQPRLTDAVIADARARLETLLNGDLTVSVDTKTYAWTPAEIGLMLDMARVAENEASDRIAIGFNPIQIERRVRKMTDEIGRGSVNPRVAWNGGDLQITRPGQTGLRLDQDGARTALFGWTGGERTLSLPVNVVQPDVSEANLRSLGIDELVSVGKSDFTGSADYRITNIGVGMRVFNGILLAPDEEFSFNDNVGSIDAANGFVEGGAIVNNRVQQEFGGGICQDSTTFFRAAFWAGLPITERWGHSFYISWYDKYALGPLGNGPGLDATIFTGGPDLKFINDTGHWMLIQTGSDPVSGTATVAFYGTKPNRQVEISQEVSDRKPAIEKPVYYADSKQPRGIFKRTDTKRAGMTIRVYRTITQDGVRKRPQLFETVFKPWADKYALNPADLSPNGQPLISVSGSGSSAPRPQPAPAPAPAPAPEPAPEPVPVDPVVPPAPQG